MLSPAAWRWKYLKNSVNQPDKSTRNPALNIRWAVLLHSKSLQGLHCLKFWCKLTGHESTRQKLFCLPEK